MGGGITVLVLGCASMCESVGERNRPLVAFSNIIRIFRILSCTAATRYTRQNCISLHFRLQLLLSSLSM